MDIKYKDGTVLDDSVIFKLKCSSQQPKYYADISGARYKFTMSSKNNVVLFLTKKELHSFDNFTREYLFDKKLRVGQNSLTNTPSESFDFIEMYVSNDEDRLYLLMIISYSNCERFPELIEKYFKIIGYDPSKNKKKGKSISNDPYFRTLNREAKMALNRRTKNNIDKKAKKTIEDYEREFDEDFAKIDYYIHGDKDG